MRPENLIQSLITSSEVQLEMIRELAQNVACISHERNSLRKSLQQRDLDVQHLSNEKLKLEQGITDCLAIIKATGNEPGKMNETLVEIAGRLQTLMVRE